MQIKLFKKKMLTALSLVLPCSLLFWVLAGHKSTTRDFWVQKH